MKQTIRHKRAWGAWLALAVLGATGGLCPAEGQWSRSPGHALEFPGIYDVRLVSDSLGGVFIPGTSGDYRAYCTRVDEAGNLPWRRWVDVAPRALWSVHQMHSIAPEPGWLVMTFNATWITADGDTILDIRAQKVNPQGELLWSDSGRAVSSISHRAWADTALRFVGIVGDGDGGVIIAYALDEYPPGRNPIRTLYARRFNGEGFPLWEETVVSWGRMFTPRISPDGLGGIFFASTLVDTIWLQRLSSDGEMHFGERGLYQFIGYRYSISVNSIVPDGTGGVILSGRGRNRNVETVNALRFDQEGRQLWGGRRWGFILFQAARELNYDLSSSITIGPDSLFFISVEIQYVNRPRSIVQLINLNGQTAWQSPGIEVSISDSVQRNIRGISSTSSSIYSWNDGRDFEDQGSTVFAQRISTNGERMWGNSDVMLFGRSGIRIVDICTDSRGGAIAYMWRGVGYLQHINRNGELGDVLTITEANSPIHHGVVDFSLYPNPANNKTNMQVYIPRSFVGRFMFTDINGKTLRSFSSLTGTIDLFDIPSGQYFLTFQGHTSSVTKSLQIIK